MRFCNHLVEGDDDSVIFAIFSHLKILHNHMYRHSAGHSNLFVETLAEEVPQHLYQFPDLLCNLLMSAASNVLYGILLKCIVISLSLFSHNLETLRNYAVLFY